MTGKKRARRTEPHLSGLVDRDPVPPLVTGTVVLGVLGVLAALGIFATEWLPWAMWPPVGEDVTGLLIASLVAALVGWTSLAYGIVITAAKIDDLREMLRALSGAGIGDLGGSRRRLVTTEQLGQAKGGPRLVRPALCRVRPSSR